MKILFILSSLMLVISCKESNIFSKIEKNVVYDPYEGLPSMDDDIEPQKEPQKVSLGIENENQTILLIFNFYTENYNIPSITYLKNKKLKINNELFVSVSDKAIVVQWKERNMTFDEDGSFYINIDTLNQTWDSGKTFDPFEVHQDKIKHNPP